jgi:hypothetical protein
VDKCPNEAETMNGVEDEDGCPDHESPALLPNQSYPLAEAERAHRDLEARLTTGSTLLIP